ncbi:prenyltransferase [Candidatus Micrarchaeota archaeon]|nr:prenyltransferase [Candidatus Micrarchaeota archaeon]
MASPFTVYWSQVHPVFMVAAIAAAVVGALYAPASNLPNLLVFCIAVFSALYFAHVKDSYVDYFVRGEDEFSYMSEAQAKRAMLVSALAVLACGAYFIAVGLWGVLPFLLGGFLLAYFHTPLDLNPVGATAGYPTGLALAAIGGYYVQAGTLPMRMFAFAFVVWLVLNGVKIVDDIKDCGWDARFGKITAPVFFGREKAKVVAAALVIAGALLGIALSLTRVLPFISFISYIPLIPASLLSLSRRTRGTLFGLDAMLIGIYAFTAIQALLLALRLA